MVKHCPICGRSFDDELDVCPHCGHILNRDKFNVIGYYEPSSATDYTTEYTAIVDTFKDDIESKKKKEDLTRSRILNDKWIDSFVNWGYLISENEKYNLTLLGKKAYYNNLKWRKKKKPIGENSDDNNQGA